MSGITCLIAARRNRLATRDSPRSQGLVDIDHARPGANLTRRGSRPRSARRTRTMREHGRMPVEPPPSRWALPDPADPGIDAVADDLVAMGADLEPGTLLAAYRCGLFPMPGRTRTGRRTVGWWSPVERGVLPLARHHVPRSLRRPGGGVEPPGGTAL